MNAISVSWKTIIHEHVTSKDGKRMWRIIQRKDHSYKSPGRYHETEFDENGQVNRVTITDAVKMRELTLLMKERKAVLVEQNTLTRNPRGPFSWLEEYQNANDLQWVETRQTPTGKINVFRHAFSDNANGRSWSYDFWMDQKTKQLVEVHSPGVDIYDTEKDPAALVPPEEDVSMGATAGHVDYDIVFDPELDDSLFQLEPPPGFSIETRKEEKPEVTEQDMIVFLRAITEFNGNTFPDQVFPFPLSCDRINKVWQKPEGERSAAEQKLIGTLDHYNRIVPPGLPIGHFARENTEPNTFRYLGKGVRLGDTDRIVCWYKPKGAANYRAVSSDLNVRDISPDDLPLPVD